MYFRSAPVKLLLKGTINSLLAIDPVLSLKRRISLTHSIISPLNLQFFGCLFLTSIKTGSCVTHRLKVSAFSRVYPTAFSSPRTTDVPISDDNIKRSSKPAIDNAQQFSSPQRLRISCKIVPFPLFPLRL